MATQPTSLYIHLPWCLHKCAYCDFNSHAADVFPEQEYTDTLLIDLEQSAALLSQRKVQSIFIGGGTPSLFSPAAIDRILSACNQYTHLSEDCEITLETNPGTFETERFTEFLDAGINRLSIGVQSFNDQYLQALGRIHDANNALVAIETAASIGFNNINIDLMFGLPRQSLQDALADIQTACQQPVQHISYYQLTLEPNTVFYRYPPQLPDSDTSWGMQSVAIQHLHEAGYQRYEVSAYARTGLECRHNRNYWQYGDYLGIGAGAHSKISTEHGVLRHQRTRQPASYLQAVQSKAHILQERIISHEELIFEFMLNNLRLVDGFLAQTFTTTTGLSWGDIEGLISACIDEGLIEHQGQQYRASELGYRFLDQLIERFLPTKIST